MKSCFFKYSILLIFSFSMNVMAKGPLDARVAEWAENVVVPILVENSYCKNRVDCREKELFFCVSWKTISCIFYTIKDKKTIVEIVSKTLVSDYEIGHLDFYAASHKEKSFINSAIFKYVNKIGEE